MQISVKVVGLASKRFLDINPTQAELKMTVLKFLQLRGIPVASSCSGEGICNKCFVSGKVLSCTIQLEEFIKKNGNSITLSYW